MPGPGAYDKNDATARAVVSSRFGTGERSSMESPNAKIVPGPGEHSPEFKMLKSSAPIFGFGTQRRLGTSQDKTKSFPGPGNY